MPWLQGDLAKREIYPSLWYLYRDQLLPPKTKIYGYALSQLTVADIRNGVVPFVQVSPQEEKLYDEFWSLNEYISGTNDADADYDKINRIISEDENDENEADRIFYLALPPVVFPSAASHIKRACMANKGATRIVVEKPFGRDSESAEKLSKHLTALFTEEQIYRMDHFLGYEMVQNLLSLRFANKMISSSWNKDNIAAIEIDFKENFGVEGRGGYFDSNGIIRDVMQNHLLQIMSLIAMEKPATTHPDDVRNAKVELLKKTKAITLDDVVIGQYVKNPESADPRERIGYRDDSTVADDSIASTFALTVLRIENERWSGVPFIIRAGKGLNINRTEVIIQYKNVDEDLFDGQSQRNELVIRIGKTEALQAKLMSKTPGIASNLEKITVDFDYIKEYPNLSNPGAYERLLLDVFRGTQLNFVRSDELGEAWRIFTPVLHAIEDMKIQPIEYKFGTTAVSTQECFAYVAKSRDVARTDESSVPHAFVTLGASGDLAKRKIYPSLWALYRDGLLPSKTVFYGYARSQITVDDLRKASEPFIKLKPEDKKLFDEFWSRNHYINGTNDEIADYDKLNQELSKFENNGEGNRIFYLALPPSVFPSAASQIKRACMAKGATRIVVEKPFGHDSESSEKLSRHLKSLFTEEQIYRMDHYLGKEMVQNIINLRFANQIFSSSWNKDNVVAVEVLFEEKIGVEGRGSYFDNYGIIRDVMQNHLLQVLSLIAMEKPLTNHPDDIRDAKVDLLKSTKSIVLNDVVLGQYIGNPDSKDPKERVGYREEPSVPDDSLTPTFALTVLRIENERWNGVPFIIRAGKGLSEKKTQVRIQYKNVEDDLHDGQAERNELVFKITGEAVEMKLMSKTPGITSDIEPINAHFTYSEEYENLNNPEAYVRLILDVFHGSQLNFVRTDELSEAWRIFTPVLHEIENRKIRPIDYKFGTHGPAEADEAEKKNNLF
ncbi:hypothetical protein TSAR_004697 [Trichomalopsis sarcophagae]|uniref:Glucose-6-phosphate 1-dehydrogenase n=1 Tax=Trichomalopsis sarcophagae TaxID=543379 RepID=A0A232EP76_9HYME|nr:hypothetical protein TSAR_004697 [Trichomalopsis sarcophagae]